MEDRKAILLASEAFVKQEFAEKISPDYGYHDLQHTLDTTSNGLEIGRGLGLNAANLEIIELACLFHDLGYCQTYKDHEEISVQIAVAFFTAQGYPKEGLDKIVGCIQATKVPQVPKNILEEVICDADLRTLATENFVDRSRALKQEWEQFQGISESDLEWWEGALSFQKSHTFHTEYAQTTFADGKAANVELLQQMIADLKKEDPSEGKKEGKKHKEGKENTPKKNKKKKPKVIEDKGEFAGLTEEEIAKAIKRRFKEKTPERGVETMFRTSSRNHIQLSAIADNKANIMLSINAIIVSIIVSTLVPRLSEDPFLAIPTVVILLVCVLSIIFATLSTIPKITEGTFTKKDIENKTANLLFFGNFHSMDLNVFESGVREMMSDRDFLYGAMTRDLYFLGRVLNKKYKFLRICYNVFMYGLILAVVAFIAAYFFRGSL